MSCHTKKYPRARISRHPQINGWAIDLIQHEGARPRRVAATYVTEEFAARAALVKLGYTPAGPMPAMPPRMTPAPAAKSAPTDGTCKPCGRRMRPVRTSITQHPGTVLQQRKGLCQSCAKRAKREEVAA